MTRVLSLFALVLFPGTLLVAEPDSLPVTFEIKTPSVVLTGVGFTLEVIAKDPAGNVYAGFNEPAQLHGVVPTFGSDKETDITFSEGKLVVEDVTIAVSGRHTISVSTQNIKAEAALRAVPGFLSILPPLIAIVLALALRQVVISLFAGIYLGAVFIYDFNVIGAAFRVVDHFVVKALSEPSHVQIIVFSMLFGGMVGVISKNGGTVGIANVITRYARNARGGQLATLFMAFVIFFDDYANCLIRGNLMRPITDKLRISREKLSFIVDAGAATVASIMIISTWIGYEVGLIEQGLKMINSSEDAYAVFLQTIPFRFYPIFTLVLVFLVGFMGRDFGPMLTAERRARTSGKVIRDDSHPATDLTESATFVASDDTPARWYNGFLPILAVLIVGLYGLYTTGTAALAVDGKTSYGIGEIISKSDSYSALLWASLAGCFVAIFLSVSQRIMKLGEAIDAWSNGIKSMLLAMLILILAWSIGSVTEELHTAGYLVQILRGTIAPHWLPVLVFLIAALISFSTGTSWGTMAIMMPLVIPLGSTLSIDAGLPGTDQIIILHGVISSVLAGAVFGDHCSPISDTTILSSMASACDHIDHVRTQLPYAVLAAVVGMLVGDIPTAYGVSPWISIAAGTIILILIMRFVGKKVESVRV
ncbi:MAG: Na+/H+ antiporter NhaC family protein [Bacteroidetes bacterium]|nr:Na+/H+ antiporter NhaC family protein [Bacteroidota bacterium]MCW5895396.1 Na+/H+ antiporter NhaC family protein [Bacteroidota bacterium]